MKRLAVVLILLAGPAVLGGRPLPSAVAVAPAGRPSAPSGPPAVMPARVPLAFERDATGEDAGRFFARGPRYALRLGPTSAEVRPVVSTGPHRGAGVPLVMRFDGAAAGPREVVADRAPGTVSYLVGDRAEAWRAGLPTFTRIRYAEVYPGIDVAYYGTDREIEYDVIVSPGADPSRVRLRFDGATGVRLTPTGDLDVAAPHGPLILRAPLAHQRIGTQRIVVESRYRVAADGTVTFGLGAYDRTRPLVIDPILSYAVVVGGQGLDEAVAVAVDGSGNVYVAGTTSSPDFPGATGPGGGLDVFVTKLDPRGTRVLFSAYIGGSAIDEARGLAIDSEGHAYVVGSTTSTNFPTRNPRQPANAGGADGFVFKLSTSGAGLVFSTYHGGSDIDEASAVAVDPARNVYVAGQTRSSDLPLLGAVQGYQANLDGWVAKFSPTGTLAYGTYHAGTRSESVNGIAVDAQGNATVTGTTGSSDMPIVAAAQPTFAGTFDLFIARFSPTGSRIFSTYYGGTGSDIGNAVAVTAGGWSFVTGSTDSAPFPAVAPIQTTAGGSLDAFLMAVSPTGAVAWATPYGGARSERGRAVAVNASGRVVFAGQTFSPNLPILRAVQPATGGNRDTFVVQLDPPYAAFSYATYLGGSNNDEGAGAAIDAVGRVFVTGAAAYPFPGAGGVSDAFVYGLSTGAADVDSDGDGMSDAWETQYGLDPLVNDATEDPDGDGVTNAQELANNTHPTGYHTRYLAEGATGSFFDDRVALFNPGAALATVLLRYQREGNPELQQLLALPAHSRLTVNPETIVGLENASFSTVIESDQAVVVDRTMTWDATGFGSHAETSIEQVSTEWYLAEGATGGTFDLYYLLQNPNATASNITITYLRPSGGALTKSYTVAPRSRRTINVDNETGFAGRPTTERSLSNSDVSAQIVSTNGVPILVERAMYLTAGGRVFAAGHNSAGITTLATSWFLAEGATGSFFDLFILLANPTASATTVQITYLLQGGAPVTRQYALPAQSRRTVFVDGEPGLENVATSAIVRSLNATVPIAVERAMWWPSPNWSEAHNSAGAIVTSPRWALAEGEVGGTRANTTYVLIANTSAFAGDVRVTTYFEDQGPPLVATYTVPAQSRFNVDFTNTVAQGRRFSVLVEGQGTTPAQLVVERAMYSNSGSTIWAAGTNALATPLFPPNTLTLTPNGVFPKVLIVDQGTQVQVVNTDPDNEPTIDCSQGGHDLSDDPHPTHGDNAEFGVGRLDFGQSRLTQNLVTTGSFGVHDHCHGSDSKWWARVVVR